MITLREVIEILNTIDFWRQEIWFLFGAIKEGSKELAFKLDLEGRKHSRWRAKALRWESSSQNPEKRKPRRVLACLRERIKRCPSSRELEGWFLLCVQQQHILTCPDTPPRPPGIFSG